MKPSEALLRKAIVLIPCLIVLLVGGRLMLAMFRARACITEIRKTIPDLSGFNFEITQTNCDTLAKEGWISIFASKAGENKKVLLFEYDGDDYPLPDIKVSNDHNITISIPVIASVHVQRHKWQYGAIDYKIGRIAFPSVGK
jgi:hypothetical protein